VPEVVLEDESLRDGLQFEKQVLRLEEKLDLFHLLEKACVQRVQVGSFVHPKIIPQMADTDELIRRIQQHNANPHLTGLVLNGKGLERAIKCDLQHISLSVSASDTHSLKNVKRTSEEALTSVCTLIGSGKEAGITVRAGIQCAFGCIYEGAISEKKVLQIARRLAEFGAIEMNLADTVGMANPLQIKRLVQKVQAAIPGVILSLHLHDTCGLGIANMVAGYEVGVKIFDVSSGGLGGCPFVKGASGNIALEDAVYLFEQMGVDTGIDLQAACRVAWRYETLLQKTLPGKMNRILKLQRG